MVDDDRLEEDEELEGDEEEELEEDEEEELEDKGGRVIAWIVIPNVCVGGCYICLVSFFRFLVNWLGDIAYISLGTL